MTPLQIKRRTFLRHGSCVAAAGLCTPSSLFAGAADELATLVFSGGPGPVVSEDFIGLSYENMQLEDPGFFSPANTGLVAQFRAIAPRGVLRLGGNTSEFGWWKTADTQPPPRRVESPWKASGEPVAATVFAITPRAIDNLEGFLRSTGWTCIYGLNLGYGSVAEDVPEARYVATRLGARLRYFQIGNEVDLFKGHLRDPMTWGPGQYLAQWLTLARAVQKAIPAARFGMPDVAADVSWLPQLAELWQPVPEKPSVVTLSHHYYWNGPPSNPEANIANLLKPDPKVVRDAALASAASRQMGDGITWRMTEGNTVYRGGKPGVSDVFAAALWSARYLLELMSLGYSGVNLHGGSGHAQAVSVGGVFHGEALMPDPTVPHPKPFYTPIANEGTLAGAGVDGKLNGRYVLEPVGYGMQFVYPFVGAAMLPVALKGAGASSAAFAGRKHGKTIVAVINGDAERPLQLRPGTFRVLASLQAPALDSQEAHVVAQSGKPESGLLTVPAHTALLFELLSAR